MRRPNRFYPIKNTTKGIQTPIPIASINSLIRRVLLSFFGIILLVKCLDLRILFFLLIEHPGLRTHSLIVSSVTCTLLGFLSALLDTKRYLKLALAAGAAIYGYLFVVSFAYASTGEWVTQPMLQGILALVSVVVGGRLALVVHRQNGLD